MTRAAVWTVILILSGAAAAAELSPAPLNGRNVRGAQSGKPRTTNQRPIVRFQDLGSTDMPSFDVNQIPRAYGNPARPGYPAAGGAAPQPMPQAYQGPPPGFQTPQAFQPPQAFAAPQGPPPVYQPPSAAQVAPSYQGGVIPNPRYQPSMTTQGAPQPFAPQAAGPGYPPPNSAPLQPGQAPPYTPPGGFGPSGINAPGGVQTPQGYDTPAQMFPSDTNTWLNQPNQEPIIEVPIDVNVTEAQTGRLMLGVGVNSNAGLVGNITLDEQNFDWRRYPTSWQDIRNATAWRGGGQHFRIEAMPGTIVQRYLASFTEPYLFDTPISLGLSGYYFQRFYNNWLEERLGGRITLGYQFAPDLTASVALRMENVNISQPTVPTPPELAAVVGNNGLYTVRYSLVNDTRDSPFLASQGHRLSFSYEQAFATFSYPRGEFEGSQYFTLRQRADGSGKHILSLITVFGVTGNDTPIFENFFAGGYGTLRGFFFRGASPTDQGVQVGGHFQWLNTVEYMMPVTASDVVRVVGFCDFGTVEQNVRLDWSQFRISPGLGLRISLPMMGPAPLAFDFAVPVHKAPTDREQVFNFSMGFSR